MLKKGILLSAILVAMVILSGGAAEARRGSVVPTEWGYGVVNTGAPYIWPAYGYLGMHPAVPVAAAQMPAPAWNGANWSYYQGYYAGTGYQNGYNPISGRAVVASNLNVRSEPYVSGRKKRNSNVIASLNAGEQVYVLGRSGNWYFIQSAYMPLRRGYVYGSYLNFYQNNLPGSQYSGYYPPQVYARGW